MVRYEDESALICSTFDCGVKTPTPRLNIALLHVPTEILEEVIVLVIQAIGLDEAMNLRLVCRKAKSTLDWKFNLNVNRAI
jgi:hypothetical protein